MFLHTFSILGHFETDYYLPVAVIFSAFYADVVCGKGRAVLFLEVNLCGLEQGRCLPQWAIVSFSLDVEEGGSTGGVGLHAECEAQPEVVYLVGFEVEVAEGIGKGDRGGF